MCNAKFRINSLDAYSVDDLWESHYQRCILKKKRMVDKQLNTDDTRESKDRAFDHIVDELAGHFFDPKKKGSRRASSSATANSSSTTTTKIKKK